MPEAANYGILAMVPLTITLVLAFWKKDAVFALFIGCIAGVMILGMDPAFGFSAWRRRPLATRTLSGFC